MQNGVFSFLRALLLPPNHLCFFLYFVYAGNKTQRARPPASTEHTLIGTNTLLADHVPRVVYDRPCRSWFRLSRRPTAAVFDLLFAIITRVSEQLLSGGCGVRCRIVAAVAAYWNETRTYGEGVRGRRCGGVEGRVYIYIYTYTRFCE